MGFYVKSGLQEMVKKIVKLSMPQKAPKRRSPNIGERRAKWQNLKSHFLP